MISEDQLQKGKLVRIIKQKQICSTKTVPPLRESQSVIANKGDLALVLTWGTWGHYQFGPPGNFVRQYEKAPNGMVLWVQILYKQQPFWIEGAILEPC